MGSKKLLFGLALVIQIKLENHSLRFTNDAMNLVIVDLLRDALETVLS